MAVSGDGNTVIFGGNVVGPSAGRVWVFTRSGGNWVQQGNPILTSGIAGLAQQAWAVALSGDGNTAVLAEPGDNVGMGAAWVFTRSSGVWTQQGNKMVGAGATGMAEQGYSAAISADASTIVIGGPADNGGRDSPLPAAGVPSTSAWSPAAGAHGSP
jgi:hypothetical protein